MFVHLHSHSYYSFLQAVPSPKLLVEAAKKGGFGAVGLTDSSNTCGVVEASEAAEKAGVKLVVGVELWTIEEAQAQAQDEPAPGYQLVLLVRDGDGWKNLCRLLTMAHRHRNFTPRIRLEDLGAHRDGLHVLTGSRWGLFREKEKAEDRIRSLVEAVGADRVDVEVSDLGFDEDGPRNDLAIYLAKELSLPVVATNDVRYLDPLDCGVLEAMNVIATSDLHLSRTATATDQATLKTEEEMRELFPQPFLDRSSEVAALCSFVLPRGKPMLPRIEEGETYQQICDRFPSPKGFPNPPKRLPGKGPMANRWFRWLTKEGLKIRLRDEPHALRFATEEEYFRQLDFECGVIEGMDYVVYHLIVSEFTNWAKDNGIAVAPGRGSAAGSIAVWALRITDVNPRQFGLFFERFLNPERRGLPDIDMDFEQEGRQRVVDHVRQKYGQERVGQILTIGKMKAKAALKDAARVCDVRFEESNRWSSFVPDGPKVKLKDSIDFGYLGNMRAHSPLFRRVSDLALTLEGKPRQQGVHAAGVIIASDPLTDFCPMHYVPEDDLTCTGLDMDGAEKIGLVKFDFLGLKTLDVIKRAAASIKEKTGTTPVTTDPLFDDPAVFEMLRKADTEGIFQLESSGMTRLIKRLQPTSFEDVICMLALYRPGPLKSGMVDSWVERRHGREPIESIHPLLDDLLSPTYGLMVYQEQCGAEGSPVWTVDGPVPIEGMKIGDMVATSNGPKKVTKVTKVGTRDCITITTSTGQMTISRDHPVKVRRGPSEDFVRADHLHVDDMICFVRNPPTRENLQIPTDENLLEAWRAGYCAGNLCKGSSPSLACGAEERTRKVARKFDGWNGCAPHVYFNTRSWYVGLYDPESRHRPFTKKGEFRSRITKKLDEWGLNKTYSKDKSVPGWVLKSHRDIAKAYLVGLFDSDGHVPERGSKQPIHATSINDQNLDQIHWLCWSVGISARKRENRVYVDSLEPLVKVSVKVDSLKDYSTTKDRKIGEILVFATADLERRRARIPTNKRDYTTMRVVRRNQPDHLVTEDLQMYARVLELENSGEKKVWDLTVEETPEFCIGGLVVHNCISTAQILAGFSLGGADLLRRAIGKKKPEEMAQQKQLFVDGCQKTNGIVKKESERIFAVIEYFSGYGFNKSHSAAYAIISYMTARLKAYHRAHFMAASMTLDMGSQGRIRQYVSSLRRSGIQILRPDVNRSASAFSEEDGAVRFGLGAVKGLGQAQLPQLIQGRTYEDVTSLVERGGVHKSVAETLIWAGALDSVEPDRFEAWWKLNRPKPKPLPKKVASSQVLLFGGGKTVGDIKDEEDKTLELSKKPQRPTSMEISDRETAALGITLGEHPLRMFEDVAVRVRTHSIEDLWRLGAEKTPFVLVVRIEVLEFDEDRRGDPVAFVTFEDGGSSLEVVLRSHVLAQIDRESTLVLGACVAAHGVADAFDPENPRVIVERLELMPEFRWRVGRVVELEVRPSDREILPAIRALLDAKIEGGTHEVQVLVTTEGDPVKLTLDRQILPDDDLVSALERLCGRPSVLRLPTVDKKRKREVERGPFGADDVDEEEDAEEE